jgi:nucleoside-diphosphate-sugar epimerase
LDFAILKAGVDDIPTSHVFLTGSTGTIGRRWLPLLLAADPRREVTVLVRDVKKAYHHPRVSALVGDLRSPRLGLSPSVWDRLAGSITAIVHCGADIRFSHPIEATRATNAEGTRTMLALARDVKGLRGFAFISTAYVMGRDTGALEEGEHSNIAGFVNTYEESKYEAEAAVLASMDEIPAAIFRLSSVAGEETGYLRQALRMIPHNPLPMLPALPMGYVDLIGEHWACAALNALFERHFRPGAVFNICAGKRGSIRSGRLVEMAFSALGAPQPSMVSLERFEKFAEFFLSSGAREVDKRMLRSVSHFLPHLALDQTFQNEATMALLEKEGIEPADSVEVFGRVLASVALNLTREAVPAGEAVR